MATSYAIRFQLLDFTAVRKWGDYLLETNTQPPLWAIDLADCHRDDVDERLRRVPGTPVSIAWQSLLCGLISSKWTQKQISIGTMRGIGWMLYIEHNYHDGHPWGLELECVGDAFDDGWGTLDELEHKCAATSQQFAELTSLVPNWMIEKRAEHIKA